MLRFDIAHLGQRKFSVKRALPIPALCLALVAMCRVAMADAAETGAKANEHWETSTF